YCLYNSMYSWFFPCSFEKIPGVSYLIGFGLLAGMQFIEKNLTPILAVASNDSLRLFSHRLE
ncbi:MAG: hypothetical protein J7K90_08460, partial [Desulfuromusa sp.]|nr:hypothetical protein [Desulfuromusa sp.]